MASERTEVVFTDFTQGALAPGEEPEDASGEAPQTNFASYNAFCLSTKLAPTVAALGQDLTVTFTGYEERGGVRYAVELVRAGRLAALDKPAADVLRAAVAAARAYPRHCLLYSCAVPGPAPQRWAASVLPFVDVDPALSPVLESGNLFVDLSGRPAHDEVWAALHDGLLARLAELRAGGALVCHPELDADAIAAWALEPVYPAADGEATLYRPAWRDRRFAPDLSAFLEERLRGSGTIEVRVGRSLVVRHFVAQALAAAGVVASFRGPALLAPARSLERALFVAATAERAARTAHGAVSAVALLGAPPSPAELSDAEARGPAAGLPWRSAKVWKSSGRWYSPNRAGSPGWGLGAETAAAAAAVSPARAIAPSAGGLANARAGPSQAQVGPAKGPVAVYAVEDEVEPFAVSVLEDARWEGIDALVAMLV